MANRKRTKGQTTTGVRKFPKSSLVQEAPGSTRHLLVLKNFLLVLDIGMEEIKFVEHKINLHPQSSRLTFYLTNPPGL